MGFLSGITSFVKEHSEVIHGVLDVAGFIPLRNPILTLSLYVPTICLYTVYYFYQSFFNFFYQVFFISHFMPVLFILILFYANSLLR